MADAQRELITPRAAGGDADANALQRCPACRARLGASAQCPRCACELGLVRLCEAESQRQLAAALRAWAIGEHAAAHRAARAAHALVHSPLSRALLRELARS